MRGLIVANLAVPATRKGKCTLKIEAIALAKTAKGKNKMMNDERGEESDEFPPLIKLKQQNRKRQRLIIGNESDPDCRSSSCSPLTISDNESVDEMEVSGDEVQTKTDEDSEPEGVYPRRITMWSLAPVQNPGLCMTC